MSESDHEISRILASINDLLHRSGEPEWQRVFDRLQVEHQSDRDEALVRMNSLFGGAGSFNDLVLFSNGKVLRNENSELDALRKQLYGCVKYKR